MKVWSLSSSMVSMLWAISWVLVSSLASPYLAVGVRTSASKTASQQYTREKGVWPVEVLGVVRLAHKILGNSSAYLPCWAASLLLIPVMMALLLASACLLACGYRGVDVVRVIFHSLQNSLVLLLMNWDPLSHTISAGIPNLYMMLVRMNEITSLSLTWG